MINKNKLIPLIALAITVILTLSPINSITSHALIAETTVEGWIDTSVSGIKGSDLDASDGGVIDVAIYLSDMKGKLINNPAYIVDVSSDSGTLVALTPINKDGIVNAQIQLNPGVTSAKVNSTVTYENVNCENTKAYKEPVFTQAQLADQEEFEFLLFDDNVDFSDWVTYDPIEEEALPDDTTSGDAESAALLDAWLLDATPTDKEEQTLLESFDLTFGEDFTFDFDAPPTDEEVALEYTDPKACIQSYASQNLKFVELVAVGNPVTTTPTLPLPPIKPVATPAPVPVAAVTPIKPVNTVTDSTTPRTGGVVNYVVYAVTMLMIVGMYIAFGKSKRKSKLYFSNLGKIGKTGIIGKISKFGKTNRSVSFDKVKTTKVIKSIFMLFIALILSSASLMMLNIDLESNAATTQNLYIFKENVGGSNLYSQTIDGKEVANFSMYDNRDGSFCSISTLRKPDKSEIRYYVEKNNLGKNMINYFTKTGINKGATKINWQGDRVFIEGNKDGYVSKLSSGKFNTAATTYVQKPLTDVKAIDKKILDVCNTADGINKVNKLFKDEKSAFFKPVVTIVETKPKPPIVPVVDKNPKPPIDSNLTYLSQTSADFPDAFRYSVLDNSTGQFCSSFSDSIKYRLDGGGYDQEFIIKKGRFPLDILKNVSTTRLVRYALKNADNKFFESNSSVNIEIVKVGYDISNYSTGTSEIKKSVDTEGLAGFQLPVNEVPGAAQRMLSDCMKTDGIQNAVNTYKTRFK